MGGGGASPLPPHTQARAGAVYSGKNYRTAPLVGPIMCRVAAANYRSALLIEVRPGAVRSVPWRQLYGYFNIKSGIFLLRHGQFFAFPSAFLASALVSHM